MTIGPAERALRAISNQFEGLVAVMQHPSAQQLLPDSLGPFQPVPLAGTVMTYAEDQETQDVWVKVPADREAGSLLDRYFLIPPELE
jgi:hypothetical protein